MSRATRFFLALVLLALIVPGALAAQETPAEEPIRKVSVVNIIVYGSVFLAVFGMVPYSIFILYFRKKTFVPYAPGPDASAEADGKALAALDSLFGSWSLKIEGTGEDETRMPGKKAEIEASYRELAAIAAMKPKGDEAVARLNEIGGCVEHAQARTFQGSWLIMIGSSIIWLLLAINTFGQLLINPVGAILGGLICLASPVAYFFASMRPNFMQAKRELGRPRASSDQKVKGFFAGLFTSIPFLERWVYRRQDGSIERTSEGVNPAYIMMVILSIAGAVFMMFIVALIGIISFVRNYLLYA